MIFLGAPYPILKNTKGFLYTQNGIDQIKSDLLVLLLTNPGERVMLSGFGTPLKSLIFEPNDSISSDAVRLMIANAIANWEPRVTISSIDVINGADTSALNSADPKQDLQNMLSINIQFFDPENIKDVQSLVLELPLNGGTT